MRIYVSVIRPVVEYACPVWHSSLPQYLSDLVETVHKRSLKTIYPGYTYDEIILMTKLHTLVERRNDICKRHDHKLHDLLPEPRNVPYSLRKTNELPIPKARTNRSQKSFIPWALSNC